MILTRFRPACDDHTSYNAAETLPSAITVLQRASLIAYGTMSNQPVIGPSVIMMKVQPVSKECSPGY